ncbi:MAG: hypothetical protein RR651_08330 [Lysinibacillus sp.]
MDKIILLYISTGIWIVMAYLVKGTLLTSISMIIALGMLIWANIERNNAAARRDANRRRVSEEALAQIPHTQHFLATDYLSALLINEETRKFYMAKREENDLQFEIKEFTFKQILEAAIEEDGTILSLYPKEGLFSSTLLTRDESSVVYIVETDEDPDEEENEDETVEKLSLKLVVDDLGEPIVEYVFIENDEAIAKEADDYQEAFTQCNEWYKKMSVIIKRHERVPVRPWR